MIEFSSPVTIAIPCVAALLIWITRQSPNVRDAITLITTLVLFGAIYSLVPEVLAQGYLYSAIAQPMNFLALMPGLPLAFNVEPLGLLYALIASFLWIVNSIYAFSYMRKNSENNQARFYVLFALSMASCMGIAFSANFFTFFLFYECLTLASYPLVSHRGTAEAVQSARTYLGVLLGTSFGFLLVALIATYALTGTTDFTHGGVFDDYVRNQPQKVWIVGVIFLLAMLGLGKAALMPFHLWLPAAMVAPTPVSALLHAVAVVNAGVFAVAKISVFIFGVETLNTWVNPQWLVYLAVFTVLAASGIALFQTNLKLLLAYSTISQLSYVILGVALLTPVSLMAAGLHIVAHAFGKITLFFAAGSIYTATHKTKISELDGIGRRMPWTMGAFTLGAFSIIGLPPTVGFLSKWYLLIGIWDAKQTLVMIAIVLSTVLNAAYFLPIIYRAFFVAPLASENKSGEAPLLMILASTITAIISVLLFFAPDLVLDILMQFRRSLV